MISRPTAFKSFYTRFVSAALLPPRRKTLLAHRTHLLYGIPTRAKKTISTTAMAALGGGGTLQYISFEEGRISPVQAIAQDNGLDALQINGNMELPDGKRGAYDYYIRDYQSNVRMILTEETHISNSTATMEDADNNRKLYEESVFGQTGGGNEVALSRNNKPSGWQSNTSNKASLLGKNYGSTIGPNSLLKVMAGDEVTATTQYYYTDNFTNSSSNSLTTDIIANLATALSGGAATVGTALHNSTVAGTVTNGLNTVPFTSLTDPHRYNGDNAPRAYLQVLFFDERFNFIGENSTVARAYQSGDNAAPLLLTNIKAPKNGYAYVFVTNESNEPVYFDNFKVQQTRGRIIEENHYYAYGLKIAGISSHKLADTNEGHVDNKYLYNDKELWEEGDLNWYDYGFRNYDPQIGRFPQLDPLTHDYPELTNYQYASNDPILNIDIDGLEGGISTQVLKEVVVKSTPRVANKVAEKVGGEIIKQAFKEGLKDLIFLGTRLGGTVLLAIMPTYNGLSKGGVMPPQGYSYDPKQGKNVKNTVPYEQITNDPSKLSDDYLKGVEERLSKGKGTFNDLRYGEEVKKRKTGVNGIRDIIHHIASDKHLSIYTKRFIDIVKKYGLKLDQPWNKVDISNEYHYSRHPKLYHEFVLKGLRDADAAAGGGGIENQDKFIEAFNKFVKEPLMNNPNILNKTGW